MPQPKRERELERDDLDVDDKDKVVVNDDSMLSDDTDGEDAGLDNAEARRERKREEDRRAAPDEDDERLAYDDGDDDDGTTAQLGRRARRNRAKRLREQQAQQQIAALVGETQTLRQQLVQMSRGQLSLAAGDIDGQIAQLQGHIQTIDDAHARAVTAGEGAEATKALRLARDAEARLQNLLYERRRLEAAAQQRTDPRQTQQQRPQAQTAPNPVAVRLSEKFMARHPWFDPEDPSDEESQIVKAIDDALANEGSNPGTKQHWQELERRVKARGLGAGGDMRDDDDDDTTDETSSRRPAQRRSGGMPPRAGRGSGGRGPGGRGDFTLTPMMRDALDAEGILETKGLTEDQLKYRKKLTTAWREGTQKATTTASRQ